MHRLTPMLVAGLVAVLATAACAGTAIPSADPDTIGTIVAATMAAITPAASATAAPPTAALPTLVLPTPALPTSALPTTSAPPTLQPVAPSAVLPSATRVNFLTGATSAVITQPIQAGGAQTYVLQALQAQPMIVNVDSLNQDVTLSIRTQGGTNMLSAAAKQSTWQGSLPQTEDYYLTVHGGASTENFTLNVVIPSRIKFKEGADSAKVTGKTVGGYDVLYTVFAIKDQKMTVDLSNFAGDAALTIWGFNDGQPYVRSVSEQTHFTFNLPATQDYIIQVVPRAGSTVSYLLNIKIQ